MNCIKLSHSTLIFLCNMCRCYQYIYYNTYVCMQWTQLTCRTRRIYNNIIIIIYIVSRCCICCNKFTIILTRCRCWRNNFNHVCVHRCMYLPESYKNNNNLNISDIAKSSGHTLCTYSQMHILHKCYDMNDVCYMY